VPPILLAPALAESEHAEVIVSIANELRANFARTQNIPINKVRLQIALASRDCPLVPPVRPRSAMFSGRGRYLN
jgi:hypothetical protein